jgi:hypothetical protein
MSNKSRLEQAVDPGHERLKAVPRPPLKAFMVNYGPNFKLGAIVIADNMRAAMGKFEAAVPDEDIGAAQELKGEVII